MMALYFLAFLAMAAGIMAVLHITLSQLMEEIPHLLPHRKGKINQELKKKINPKKPNVFKRTIAEAQTILKATNQSGRFASLCALSFLLAILGVFTGSLMGNIFLMPVLGIGCALLPFLYILLESFRFKKRLNRELETSLSVITAEYIRTEDIVSAVRESLDSCQSPVKEVFQKFLSQVTSIDPDVVQALEKIRVSFDNDVWREWIDAVIQCHKNRTRKSTLQPIVRKLSDMRIVSGNLNTNLYQPFREWSIVACLLLSFPVLIWLLNKDWFHILMYTTNGHILLAADAAMFFFSLVHVIRLTRPVEYRR